MEDFDSVDTITYVDENQQIVGQAEVILRGEMSFVTAHLNLVTAPKYVLEGFKEAAQQFWLIPQKERENVPALSQPIGSTTKDPQVKARQLVAKFIDARNHNALQARVYEIEIISFNEALQNWTCLLKTTLDESIFFYVVYNGDKEESYFEVLKQAEAYTVRDESILW